MSRSYLNMKYHDLHAKGLGRSFGYLKRNPTFVTISERVLLMYWII